MFKKYLIITALVCLIFSAAKAQQDSLSLARLHFQLQSHAGKTYAKFGENQPPAIKLKLQSFMNAVDAYIQHTPSSLEGQHHHDAIQHDVQLLDSLNRQSQLDTSILFYVRDDLKLKTKLNDLGLDSRKGGDIYIKVFTKRLVNNTLTTVTGYYLYWNYWLDKNLQKPRGNFQNPTAPFTGGYLSAGYYDFWVQKIGTNIREPLDHSDRKMVIDPSQPENLTIILIVK